LDILDAFVDTFVTMAIQAEVANKAITLSMSAASIKIAAVMAAITVMVALMKSVFIGGPDSSAEIQRATEAFIESIKRTLLEFEGEILSTLDKLTLVRERGTGGNGWPG